MTARIFGYDWADIQAMQQGAPSSILSKPIARADGDHGADPIGDGTFRMVPSGDIVDYAERCRRLGETP